MGQKALLAGLCVRTPVGWQNFCVPSDGTCSPINVLAKQLQVREPL